MPKKPSKLKKPSKKTKTTTKKGRTLVSIIEPKSKQEFEATLKAAKGNVVVDFTQQGCGACDPESLKKIQEKCEGTTLVRVDCTEGWGSDLADTLGVEGTPTTLLAQKADAFKKALTAKSPAELGELELEEIDPTDAATLNRIKCAR